MIINDLFVIKKEVLPTNLYEITMDTINEAEFNDFLENHAVSKIQIIQNNENTYDIVARLNWKKGDFHLVTTRGHKRSWVSLDRLVRHLKSKTDLIPQISLILSDPQKK